MGDVDGCSSSAGKVEGKALAFVRGELFIFNQELEIINLALD